MLFSASSSRVSSDVNMGCGGLVDDLFLLNAASSQYTALRCI